MKNDTKTRIYLFIGSALTIVMVAAFLVILNINEPAEYTSIPFSVLWILTAIACIAMAVFYAKGPVFDLEGRLESGNINAMVIAVLVVIKISFFFEIVSVRNQIINYRIYDEIRRDFDTVQDCSPENLNDTLRKMCDNGMKEISIIDEERIILYSSDEEAIRTTVDPTKYIYTFSKNEKICFILEDGYVSGQLKTVILNLLTVLVTSIFFSVEMVFLVIRIVSRRMDTAFVDSKGKEEDTRMLSSLYYIRQISFLFYFASRLSSAFIPILAKSLYNPFKGLADTAAAGIPQSAETLLTCSAIFLTTLLLEKKGWKIPFLAGLIMVAAGTFMSAVSGNLIIFILARAVVGLGYGFCWMTLRNLSLFGKNDKEQMVGFALLNAGIYAGMNCGASLGSILAEIFDYKTVFMVSALLTLLSSVFIIRMENAVLPKKKAEEEPVDAKEKGYNIAIQHKLIAILFVILMIAPASIAASYISYYLPLYFESIGKSVTDVGRAQLLYGIVIVYAGPALATIVVSFKKKALRNIGFVYNMLISLSLFIAGLGSGMFMPLAGAALLGVADSFGFGVQNNYFLSLPAVKNMGDSKSLSILSFIKKMLEMIGPMVFAIMIVIGYQAGIRTMAVIFAVMAVIFMAVFPVLNLAKVRREE